MTNWYTIIKQANALAKSLGLPGGSHLYKEIQKYEKQLKEDGSWQKVKNIRKKDGVEAAINILNKIFNQYRQQETVGNILHMKHTPTGGDWYFYENSLKEKKDEIRAINHNSFFETERYEELYNEHSEKIIEEYKEFAQDIVDNKLNEVNDLRYELKEDKDNLDEETFAHKLSGYDIEEEELQEIDRELDKVNAEDLTELLGRLGYEDEAIEDRISDAVYEQVYDEQQEIEKEIDQEEKELLSLTCGGQWCVSQPGENLRNYIEDGTDFLVLRRGNNPRMAIAFDSETNTIHEVQGVANEISNINSLDILDLMYIPIYDLDEILEYFEMNDKNAEDLLFSKLLELPNDAIQMNSDIYNAINRAIPEFSDYLIKDVKSMRNPVQGLIDTFEDMRIEDKNDIIFDMMTDYISENIKYIFSDDEDFIFNIIDSYSNDYKELMQKLFSKVDHETLDAYFNWYMQNPQEHEDIHYVSEVLSNIFGDELVSKYLEKIKNPYYNFASLESEDIINFILQGEYKKYNMNEFIKNNKDVIRIYNLVISNIRVKNFTKDGMILLNNFNEMSKQFKDFFGSEGAAPQIADVIFNHILQATGDTNFSQIINSINFVQNLGLSSEIMSYIYNKWEYKKALREIQKANQLSLVEGLPTADERITQKPEMPSSDKTSKNWYYNAKLIYNFNKQ